MTNSLFRSPMLIVDAFRYLLVPFLAAVLPRGMASSLLVTASRWRWLFPEHEQVTQVIEKTFPGRSAEPELFAMTLLNESTTAWKLLIGRRLHIRQHGQWPTDGHFVAAGGHFGSGLSVLWSLKQAGLHPCFVLRRPSLDWRRARPVLYYWSLVRFKLIERICSGNLIVTGGARRKLVESLESASVTQVILFDTPGTPSESDWTLPVGKAQITLPDGARDIVIESGAEVVLFLPLTNAREVDAELFVQPLGAGAEIGEAFSRKFGRALAENPGEWHFWPIIQPYLHRQY